MSSALHATPAPADFFTDTPLRDALGDWFAPMAARRARWPGHIVASVNGHLVWRRREDLRPGDERVFYDGDYSDVLAPDDPRLLIPRAECADLAQQPIHLKWED